MTPDETTELQYLAAQTEAARKVYRAALDARNEYMVRLERRRRRLDAIASAANMSSPQALRILGKAAENAGG